MKRLNKKVDIKYEIDPRIINDGIVTVTSKFLKGLKNRYYLVDKELVVGDRIIFGYTYGYSKMNGIPPQRFDGKHLNLIFNSYVLKHGVIYQLYSK